MKQRHTEIIIRIAWIVSLIGIMAAFMRPYMIQIIDTGRLANYMPWLFPGMTYFVYFIYSSLLTFMLFMKSRLGAILLFFVFISDKLFMLISLHGFDTLYIYTWLIAQSIYGLIFIVAIWATFAHRHRITADSPDKGTVAKDLKSLWLGQMPLYTAFWAYVGGGLVAVTVIGGLSLLPIIGTASTLLVRATLFMFMPVACIGTWRSASAYAGKPIWAALAKLGILVISVYIAYILYILLISLSGLDISKGTWKETLEARDFNDNSSTVEGYYDTQLDITWLADTNYAKTIGYDGDGKMTWAEAKKWAESLDVNGITGWRLPDEKPINGDSFNFNLSYDATTDNVSAPATTDGTDGGWRDINGNPVSEMGNMYYVTLGNEHVPAERIKNTGPFINIHTSEGIPTLYWSNTKTIQDTDFFTDEGTGEEVVVTFNFLGGLRMTSSPDSSGIAWPVHDGDIGKVIQETSKTSD